MSDEEDFIHYGSPLEDLNEDNLHTQKAPRLEDQIVTDKNGKRRFHGAFSGGFSAGYFNSVGSKEGWTPSSFVSSSKKRAEKTNLPSNDPRLFMDEEDLDDHGIAPQKIQATTGYDIQNQKKRKRETEHGGPIPGQPVLEELLRPSSDTVGMQLLKKLGWRPGQGIGPRISKMEKRVSEKEKQKICRSSLSFATSEDSQSDSDDDEDEAAYSSFKYAPDDFEALCLNPKTNIFGLGYQPLNKTNPFGGQSSAYKSNARVSLDHSKGFFSGQAFGVGAFEEDDEDIYTKDNMQNYDFTLGHSEESDQQKGRSILGISGLTDLLEGFELKSQPLKESKVFSLPVLPANYKPWHQPRRRRFERKEEESRGLGRHELSTEDRRRIISDPVAVKVEIRSGVKGYNSSEAPQEMNNERSLSPSSPCTALEDQRINSTKPDLKYFNNFKPFSTNSEKQKRYESYLKFKEKGLADQFHCVQLKSMTDWEKGQERSEFEKAAAIYKPLSSTMASRFTTGNFQESTLSLNSGLKDATKMKVDVTPKGTSGDGDDLNMNELDDCMKAAKSKMFGKLTQSVCEWRPAKILSKRFNVPSIFSESSSVGTSSKKSNLLASCSFLSDSATKISGKENSRQEETEEGKQGGTHSKDGSIEGINTEDGKVEGSSSELIYKEDYGLKIPVNGPPTMDLFKAIFQDSDSESEENNDKLLLNLHEEKIQDKNRSKRQSRFDKPKENVLNDNLSQFLSNAKRGTTAEVVNPQGNNIPYVDNKTLAQAKGVFKNVDFYAINQYRNENANKEVHCVDKVWTTEAGNKKSKDNSSDSEIQEEEEKEEEEYGPSLPPNFNPTKSSIKDCDKISRFSLSTRENLAPPSSIGKEKKSKHKNKEKHKHKKSKKKKQKDKKDHRKSSKHRYNFF